MADTPAKPATGAPCNACGVCCRAVTCSAGSFALGLVETFGARAPGPCPALSVKPDGRQTCGLMERPRDWMPDHARGVTPLREAVGVLVGAGAGCDEPDDPESETDWNAARKVAQRHVDRVGPAAIQKAARLLLERRSK